jgi:hypothetical protein
MSAAQLERLKKVLLQRSLSPKKMEHVIIQPNPKRFDYRIALLRERYMVAIHAIDKEDIIHEFMYLPPVTPPNASSGPSPPIPKKEAYLFQPLTANDFIINTIPSEEITNGYDMSPR